MKNDNPLAKEWFDLGEDDLRYAQLGFKDGEIFNLVCFHCQQAVEKYLKGFLTLAAIEFPKTHRLEKLISLAGQKDRKFLSFLNKVKYLDGFYIDTRYAGGVFESFHKNDAEKAIDIAKNIIKFIKNQIK